MTGQTADTPVTKPVCVDIPSSPKTYLKSLIDRIIFKTSLVPLQSEAGQGRGGAAAESWQRRSGPAGGGRTLLCLSMMVSAVVRHGWKLLRLSTWREDTKDRHSKAALVASGCSDVLVMSWQMVLQPLAEWM